MKSIHRTANLCNFRTDWIQYIPTEPLSTRPVVEIPLSNERVWEPRGGEIPIVETHEVDNSDVFMGDVINVRVSEEAPLEFTEKIKILNKSQRDCQKFSIHEVERDCQEVASLDAQLEADISKTFEANLLYCTNEELTREIGTALEHWNTDFYEIEEQINALQTQSARNVHIFYELGGTIEEAFGEPPKYVGGTPFVMTQKPTYASGSTIRPSGNSVGGGHWNNGGGGSNWNNGGGNDFGGGTHDGIM